MKLRAQPGDLVKHPHVKAKSIWFPVRKKYKNTIAHLNFFKTYHLTVQSNRERYSVIITATAPTLATRPPRFLSSASGWAQVACPRPFAASACLCRWVSDEMKHWIRMCFPSLLSRPFTSWGCKISKQFRRYIVSVSYEEYYDD